VVSWGDDSREWRNPVPGDKYMALCAGGYHGLALAADRTLVAWGENANGQCNVPQGDGSTTIAAGLYHSLALRSDGSIIAWGDNSRGQCNVPRYRRFLTIAAGSWHSVAICSDGSLVAWGWNDRGQCRVPPGRNYTSIAAGYSHSVALKADRSLIAWGSNCDGECDVPSGNDFVGMAAGSLHNVALRSNGTLVAWGRKSEGQCKVAPGSDFVSVAAGSLHSLALKRDGSIVAWGPDGFTQVNVASHEHFAVIAAGHFQSLAIRGRRVMPADVRVAKTMTDAHTEAVNDARARASVSDEAAGTSTRRAAEVNPKREKTTSAQLSHSHRSAAQVPHTASNSLNPNGTRTIGEGKAAHDIGRGRSSEALSWVSRPVNPVAVTVSLACGLSIILGTLFRLGQQHLRTRPQEDDIMLRMFFPPGQQHLQTSLQEGDPPPQECLLLQDREGSSCGRPVHESDPHLRTEQRQSLRGPDGIAQACERTVPMLRGLDALELPGHTATACRPSGQLIPGPQTHRRHHKCKDSPGLLERHGWSGT